ncbi:hypothetical protein [Burkholderia glumae]
MSAAEYTDREIARELFDLGRLTPLPRVVRIGAIAHPADAMIRAIERGWSAQYCGITAGDLGYANFRLPVSWYVRRTVSGLPTVVDHMGRTRAAMIENSTAIDPSLVLFERFRTSLEAGEDDEARIATMDRATGIRMRVSPWVAADAVEPLARALREQCDWLAEIRPLHADPFAYW